MSYDLVVWEGVRPDSDDAAGEEYGALIEQYLEADEVPATPTITRYIDALLSRWPDNDDDGGLGPWASGGAGDASGPVFTMNILFDRATEVSADAAVLAQAHGLVCYDPQEDRLRP